MFRYFKTPPEGDEWRTFSSLADLVDELDLCRVPLDASPMQAARMIELSGSWAAWGWIEEALAWRVQDQRSAAAA